MSWLVAHIIALLLAYAALAFSLLASAMYLVQERRIKAKHKPEKTPGGLRWTGCRRSILWNGWPWPRLNSDFHA